MATQKSDAEKQLQLYIYYRMKNKNLHVVADVFAKEANLEIPNAKEANLESSKYDEPLTILWESLWPTFVSTMSSESGEAGADSSVKQAMETALALLAGPSSQGAASSEPAPMGNVQEYVLPVMPQAAGPNQQWDGNVAVSPGFGNRMKQSVTSLLPSPETSWGRAGKRPENVDSDYVIGQSTISSGAGEAGAASYEKQAMEAAPAMLPGPNSQGAVGSQQEPVGNAQAVLPVMPQATGMNQQWAGNVAVSPDFGNKTRQPQTSLLPTPEASWRRAGKVPINAESDYVIGQLATGNLMAAQASGDPRNNLSSRSSYQMDSTRLAGLDSAFPRAASVNAGESGQMRLTGGGEQEGHKQSSGLRIPTVYLQYMKREVQALLAAANPPRYTFSQEVQGGSGTPRTGNMRSGTPGLGLTGWNDPNSAHASTLAGEEAEGEK